MTKKKPPTNPDGMPEKRGLSRHVECRRIEIESLMRNLVGLLLR